MTVSPTGLPIEEHIDSVRRALADTATAVLEAEPGAGKSTVVPLRLLDEPWLGGRTIIMLEPRRVAARATARRMAQLLGESPGETVGWVTRDDRNVGPTTRIQVVTEGVLTARLARDPSLAGTGLIIFDEFHERSVPGDVGFALAVELRRHGQLDAAVLVMSATLDGDAVARTLGGDEPAPVIRAPGRTAPVEIVWRPRKRRDPLVPAVVGAVHQALRGPGDVLVFLPGVGEIRQTERALHAEFGATGPSVLPLHGSLPAAEQDAALVARDGRRVILATDVAETSLTVEGITAVVDAGLARVPRYDTRTAMTSLHTVAAARANAEQRAGRAGRTGPGVAIRLWSKMEHGTRPPHLPPAITQVDMASTVLDLARRGIDHPDQLPFLDPPEADRWRHAQEMLSSIGALDHHSITALGEAMAALPVHPRLAVGIVSGRHRWLACLAAAALEDRDVLRGRPQDLPVDLRTRVGLIVDPTAQHSAADGRAVRKARDRAHQLARRADVATDVDPDLDDLGAALLRGFGDRVARAKPGIRGRFVLASGRSAKIARTDPLADASGLLAIDLGGRANEPRIDRAATLEARIDHLVYATPDLAATVAEITETWGVTPSPGGAHDGRGTRNALLRLGPHTYLEVVGPDDDQPEPTDPRMFGIDTLREPRLVTWAAAVPDIDVWTQWARARGIDSGPVIAMQRTTPDGSVLRWRLTAPDQASDGVVPFLIEWPGLNPAARSTGGVDLVEFRLSHPDPAIATRTAEHAVPVAVERGEAGLAATLFTPHGVVELSS